MNPPVVRRVPRPPQPVDPTNPTWVVMFDQWLIDCVQHNDECLDETKAGVENLRAELTAWMTASREAASNLDGRILAHLQEHQLIDKTLEATHEAVARERKRWRDLVASAYKVVRENQLLFGAFAFGAFQYLKGL